ncbi:PP2C family protein-serine/threonine phosphatase, partial [Streptomyces chartreusis]|uniref:PP2C family protein-serine/threonine phosphatase n=1 Tax=Streptomyces chartreusis TaxID=1969 RepID=UPI00380708F1
RRTSSSPRNPNTPEPPQTRHRCLDERHRGTPPPLLRLPDGHAEVLEVPGGPLLGIDPAAHFPESELRLVPGSVLALYTDGLIERRESDIGSDVDRLRASLARMGGGRLGDLADALLRDARRSADRADDIALLLTEYAPG